MKIVYSYYVLDILHKGHLLHIRNSKRLAGEDGIHIVGILSDKAVMEKKSKPILSLEQRMDIAYELKDVDIVTVQDTYSPIGNIQRIKPNILVESSSHSQEDIIEHVKEMERIDGRVFVFPYFPFQSSTDIKRKISGQS